MGIGLLVIKTSAAGEEWSNTWGIGVGGEQLGELTASDIDELRADIDFTIPGNTDAIAATNRGESSPIAALIAFHRLVTATPATITGVYLSDGKEQPNSSTSNVYWSQALNLQCLRDVSGPAETRMPLSIAWLVNRNPEGYGVKPGRVYLRHVLTDGNVKPGTRDGVEWESVAVSSGFSALLNQAVTDSELALWLGASVSPTASYVGLPRYAPAGTSSEGNLIFMNRIQSLSSHNPVSRQLTRGRRRKASTTGVGGGVGGA